MIAPSYIRHVTVTTGHCRDSLRGEVSDEAIVTCQGLLETVMERGCCPLPPGVDPACILEGTVDGRWARLQVVAQRTMMPILDLAIALHSRSGAVLWRRLHEEHEDLPAETDPEQPPVEPWCAAMLLPGISLHPEAAAWLGDMERCLAWALLELSEAAT